MSIGQVRAFKAAARTMVCAGVGMLATLLAPAAQAQTVTLYGALSNFDVINDTGQDAHGFEIEIQGMESSQIGGLFNWNRYGVPQVVPFPTGGGFYVRYMSPYDPATGTWLQSTVTALHPTATNGHQCVLGTIGYEGSGCEHFGVWSYANPTKTIYRWLVADPANPGKLTTYGSLVAIPAPVWTVQPPVQPADPVVVQAQVDPPVPPAPAKRYGDAQWMKTFKTENQRRVGLDELVADNAVVPEDQAHLETAWDLIQSDLLDAGGKQRQKRGALGGGSHAVVRRFEFYKFTGTYDPVTNQAICADGTCTAPADTEVGDFIGAQNGAANLNVPDSYTITAAVTGNGQVTDASGVIKCPSACTNTVLGGTLVTLTARPASGTVLAGWDGPCKGTALICSFNLNSSATATATFKPLYTLSIGRSGKGTIVSDPAGISCNTGKTSTCSTKFMQGTVLTLTATPDAGSTWTGWGGACSGTGLNCTVTMTKDTSVQANFK